MGISGLSILYDNEVPHVAAKKNYDDVDISAATGKETQDGPGFSTLDQLPESDFVAFAEEDVETEGDAA